MAQATIAGSLKANATMDVYRNGNAPPAAPDVAGVGIVLSPQFATAHGVQTTSTTTLRWTHIALCPLSADVRDGYTGGGPTGETISGAGFDWVYVPDKNGTKFAVVYVERVRQQGGADYLRVFLQRQAPTWPTNQL
jgi:hypothetical protein